LHEENKNQNNRIVEEVKEEGGSSRLESSQFSQNMSDAFTPILKEVDEAGKVVYKLAYYMAAHFEQIFTEVDANLETFGIKSYVIKNMTLEQVFLAIGDQELKEDREKE